MKEVRAVSALRQNRPLREATPIKMTQREAGPGRLIARRDGANFSGRETGGLARTLARRLFGSTGMSMKLTAVAAICLIWAASPVHAQEGPSTEIAQRAVERRAVEAVIWGMPAVNYDLMLQEMLDATDGEPNQVIYGAGRSTG